MRFVRSLGYTYQMGDYTIEELWEKHQKLILLYQEALRSQNNDDITIQRLNRLLEVMNTNFAVLLKIHRTEHQRAVENAVAGG